MTTAPLDPGSFRDRRSRVLDLEGRIVRVFSPAGWAEWEALARSTFFPALLEQGKVVATSPAAVPAAASTVLPAGVAGAVEHARVPFISYPYEWSFGMLREAALLQLELLLVALEEGFTLKDASPYNIQWRGARPVFIDVGSFERRVQGEPWVAYRQFCQLFLYPLLLTAYRDVRHHAWLRGSLEGITPEECGRLLRGRDVLRPGGLVDVWLQARLAGRTDGSRSVRREIRDAGFSPAMLRRNLLRLRRLVARLSWRRARSEWSDYADDCHYAEADRQAKRELVQRAATRLPRGLVWDLGSNTGEHARLVAPLVGWVVAMDRDPLAIDRLFRALGVTGPTNVTPLVVDLLDPSPASGWRGRERRALTGRDRPDLVLALALIHHLVLTGNVPVREVVDWLAALGGDVVVELVTKDDPMAQRLLANKEDDFLDYTPESFEALLAARFVTVERLQLASGTRILYSLERRA